MSNINEVAREAGVSVTTVSRTFRTPDLLNQQTKRRVLEAAERLNYSPQQRPPTRKSVGRTASTRHSPKASASVPNTLGFLFFTSRSDMNGINEFYQPILMGAQAEATLLGLHLIVSTVSRFQPEAELPAMLQQEVVAGTMLAGAAPHEALSAFSQVAPSVLIDNRDVSGSYDSIVNDDRQGMMDATRYLIGLGHRRIGFVMDDSAAPSFVDRLHGYLGAHWEAGLTPNPDWIVACRFGELIEPPLEAILSAPGRPTAMVAANDGNALGVIKVCHALKIDVPGDLSLVGFDDMPFASQITPALTTMRVDKEYMGRLAVARLWERIWERAAGRRPGPPVQIVLPVSLVVRGSCALPSSLL